MQKAGVGYTNVNVYMSAQSSTSNPYDWSIIFNSAPAEEVVIPQIPIELQNFNIYNTYQNDELNILRLGLEKYDNIDTYANYLENIFKANKSFARSAPKFESIFIGAGYYYIQNRGYLFTNWYYFNNGASPETFRILTLKMTFRLLN